MNRNLTFVLAAAGFATLAAAPARAALVNYNFVVSVDSGPLASHSYSGQFSYDAAQLPGSNAFGDTTYSLTSFSFDFEGSSFSLADFLPGAPLLWTLPVGETPGLDGALAAIAFTPGGSGFASGFAYDRGRGVAGFGSVSYVLQAGRVPEPASAALVMLALLGLGAALRRR
jgi:hypothetical protein